VVQRVQVVVYQKYFYCIDQCNTVRRIYGTNVTPVNDRTTRQTMTGSVFDGYKTRSVDASQVAGSPPKPILGGNGNIFVSIVSYRGSYDCRRSVPNLNDYHRWRTMW